MKEKVAMRQWFSEKIDNDEEFLNDICLSDDTHFLLHIQVNSKTRVFGESEVSERIVGSSLLQEKCTVWIAIFKRCISSDHSLKMITVI